ncbi:MAG: hypothetical protein FWE20_00610 [Defluviitaleaceae bacterium]|nr:hypothetical protein [Defluviitaleaceae bacterium]
MYKSPLDAVFLVTGSGNNNQDNRINAQNPRITTSITVHDGEEAVPSVTTNITVSGKPTYQWQRTTRASGGKGYSKHYRPHLRSRHRCIITTNNTNGITGNLSPRSPKYNHRNILAT